jgi:hypothetical protein
MGPQARRALSARGGDRAARGAGRPRLCPGRFFVAATCVLLLATTPLALRAQDPPPPPPPDTAVAPAPVDAPPAETVPPPRLAALPHARVVGASAGVWRWDRAALLAEVALSVSDLVERLPGVDVLRGGTYLQPEAGRVFGGTADRIEVVWNGFVLDPLHASALDLSTIRLASLAEVVVERRLDLLRVHLRTDEPVEAEPYSRVEAMVGVPSLNAFRGVLLVPRFAFGPFSAGVERLETDGRQGVEPADVFETWVTWGWVRPTLGVQAEMRSYTLNRRPGSPWPRAEDRRDVIVRARSRLTAGLVGEAYVGRSTAEVTRLPAADTVIAVERSTAQAGARASYGADAFELHGAVRWRSLDALPALHVDVGGGFSIGTIAAVAAEATHTAWRHGDGRLGGRAWIGTSPGAGLRVFAEASTGARASPHYALERDTLDQPFEVVRPPLASTRTALRAGAAREGDRVSGGGALVRVETDSVPAFRMPFDSAFTLLAGGATSGVEAWGRVPIPRTAFAVEGTVVSWFAGEVWAYQPQRSWRVGAVLDASPLESGNLRIIGRADGRHRGAYLAPRIDEDAAILDVVPASTGLSASLIIHIIDVQVIGRYENLGGRMLADVPGRPAPGARFYYGVRWTFWN